MRDALAYLTLIANPADAQAFRRAVATPRRGVGERTAGQIVARARERHDGDLIAASANAGTLGEIGSRKAREQLERFGDGLQQARAGARGRPLARTRGDRRGDAPWRAGRPPPAEDRALRRRRRASRRGASARGPALAVPRRAGLRGARALPHPDRLPRARSRTARPRADPRPGPADHRLDHSPRQRHRGTRRDPRRMRGAAAALVAVAGRSRAAAGRTATVLRRLHAGQGPALHDPRRRSRRARDRGPVAFPDQRPGCWRARGERRASRRYRLRATSAAEALLVLALQERHAETLQRGELGQPRDYREANGDGTGTEVRRHWPQAAPPSGCAQHRFTAR